jgi:hypothetical protein
MYSSSIRIHEDDNFSFNSVIPPKPFEESSQKEKIELVVSDEKSNLHKQSSPSLRIIPPVNAVQD